jgi:hypothetical protein
MASIINKIMIIVKYNIWNLKNVINIIIWIILNLNYIISIKLLKIKYTNSNWKWN